VFSLETDVCYALVDPLVYVYVSMYMGGWMDGCVNTNIETHVHVRIHMYIIHIHIHTYIYIYDGWMDV
jgi:hypothetical protein